MTKLAIVSGGLGEPSSTRLLADRITAAVEAALAGRKLTATASVIELRRLGRAIMDTMLTGFAPSDLESVFETVADADGVIAVTPAFNASFSGLFKSFFDVLPEETLSEMPVLEHALRPMFSYLHAIVSPTGVYAATDDFGAQQSSVELSERIGKAAEDFARLLWSCGPRTCRDVFTEELTDMERLLAGWQPRGGGETVED